MTFQEIIAERILFLCKEQNLTVHGLATKSGISYSTIDNIVRKTGRSKSPEAVTLIAIALALGTTLSKLCDVPEINEGMLDDLK